jgi:hypothetical protein
MTATEQRAASLFHHPTGLNNGPATAVSCVSANVGSITDFLFSSSSSHSALSSSSSSSTTIPANQPSQVEHNDTREEQLPSSSSQFGTNEVQRQPPHIVVHTISDMTIADTSDQLPSETSNRLEMNRTLLKEPSIRSEPSEGDNEHPNDLNVSGNKEKLGHRRVDETGTVTYKKVMVDDLMKSLQIGLNYVLGKHHQPQRPVLLQDFQQIEYQDFPPYVSLASNAIS